MISPRLAHERVPTYRELAPGVLEARTSEGTDYVFLGGENTLQYESDELAFSGRAGAVRVRPDGMHFVLATAEGRERMIYMTHPATIQGIPALWIDGVGTAPGYSGDLAVPVLSGRHEISIRAAEQPDLFK